MPVKSVNPSPLFIERVEAYRKQQGLQSWSMALIALASIGMKVTGIIDGEEIEKVLIVPKWGGLREKK